MKECSTCNGCFDDSARFCPNDGSPLVETLPAAREIGGRWLLERVAGVGRLGSVYHARDIATGGEAFIKTLLPILFARKDALASFTADVEKLERLEHPAAARIFGGGALPNGGGYLAMEHVEGRTLKHVLADSPTLDVSTVVSGGALVADALGAAHALGIVHRDVKPDKVLLAASNGDEHLKLFDFELAKWIQGGSGGASVTATGSLVIRLPHYASPEQCKGEELDARSDVYSAGVVIYEMLTGRLPFDATSPMALIIKHVTDPPEPLTTHRADIPPAVEEVVLKALQKDRAKRFQNGAEFAEALRESLAQGSSAPAFPRAEAPPQPVAAPMTPPPSEAVEKRKIPAPKEPLPMRMTIVDAGDELHASRLIDGQVLDVSEYGMRIQTGTIATGRLNIIRDHTTAFKNRLEIDIDLPSGKIRVSGFAAWYKPAPDGLNWSVGIYIRDMTSKDRQQYDAYLRDLAAGAQ